jgi:hypothetical protein
MCIELGIVYLYIKVQQPPAPNWVAGLDQFKTELTVPNLENNKYNSSNVYNNSTSYI